MTAGIATVHQQLDEQMSKCQAWPCCCCCWPPKTEGYYNVIVHNYHWEPLSNG